MNWNRYIEALNYDLLHLQTPVSFLIKIFGLKCTQSFWVIKGHSVEDQWLTLYVLNQHEIGALDGKGEHEIRLENTERAKRGDESLEKEKLITYLNVTLVA